MQIPNPPQSYSLDIDPSSVAPDDFGDPEALRLVVQDAATADAFLGEKMWPLRWREIDTLYQSPRIVSTWEGTNVAEANVTSYTIAKHVNSIVPQLTNGIFYDDPPFLLRPRPGTEQDVVRAKSAVFSAQLEDMTFEEQIEDGLFYTCLFGTAIYKWGWLTRKKKEKRYVRKEQPQKIRTDFGDITVTTKASDEFKVQEIEKDADRPHFEHIDLRYVLVDPGCRKPDIRTAKWVIHRMYLTYNDLNNLRDEPGWNIPSETTLRAYFKDPKEQPKSPNTIEQANAGQSTVSHAQARNMASTADPFEQPLKVEERWDGEKVIAVLQDKIVIRNEENPFGVIPFYSSHWWRIPDSFYSLGVGHLVGQDQRVQQGLRNAALNLLGLATNPNYLRSRGANVPTQQIRQRRGGIIDVDGDVEKAFKILEIPKVPPEVWTALQNSEAESESASGANELLVQGQMPAQGRTSIGRTATGASALGNASASRLQGPVTRFIANVFEPWLYQMDELDRERLPMSTLRDILGEELGPSFQIDEEAFLNAKCEYEILAGAHLAAKKGMAQALPLISQIFENQQILQQLQQRGWTVDVKELLDMFMEISEWRNTRSLIRKLTPEELQFQQQQAQQALMAKVAPDMAMQKQKTADKGALNEQQNEAKATNEVLRQVLEQAMTHIAVQGEPGGTGFGSEV